MVEEPAKDLAQLLGELAIELQQQTSRHATLQAITEGAVDLIPGLR